MPHCKNLPILCFVLKARQEFFYQFYAPIRKDEWTQSSWGLVKAWIPLLMATIDTPNPEGIILYFILFFPVENYSEIFKRGDTPPGDEHFQKTLKVMALICLKNSIICTNGKKNENAYACMWVGLIVTLSTSVLSDEPQHKTIVNISLPVWSRY